MDKRARQSRAEKVAKLIETDGKTYDHSQRCWCIIPRISVAAGLTYRTDTMWHRMGYLGLSERAYGDLVQLDKNPANDRAKAVAVLRHYGKTGVVDWSIGQ